MEQSTRVAAMNASTRRTIILVATAAGALVPFRPLFFERADPATEKVDLIICPMYLIGRLLPPMSDFGSLGFLAVAVAVNVVFGGECVMRRDTHRRHKQGCRRGTQGLHFKKSS